MRVRLSLKVSVSAHAEKPSELSVTQVVPLVKHVNNIYRHIYSYFSARK